MQPTIQTPLDELLTRWPSAATTLARHGMACVGCSMARFETLGEAAASYGLDANELLGELMRRGKTRRRRTREVRRRP